MLTEALIDKKQVFKKWKGKVECLYEGHLEANVYFANDLQKIKTEFVASPDT